MTVRVTNQEHLIYRPRVDRNVAFEGNEALTARH